MATNVLIKDAELKYFEKQLRNKMVIKQKVNDTKHIVEHYLPHLIAAKDLTNENIPLTVTKIGENLYEFSREIPQKLIFKTYEDAKAFVECWENYNDVSLYYYIDIPYTPLPDTKIMSLSMNIDNSLFIQRNSLSLFSKCLLTLTCIGIPFVIYNQFDENNSMEKILNTGLNVTLTGTFNTM